MRFSCDSCQIFIYIYQIILIGLMVQVPTLHFVNRRRQGTVNPRHLPRNDSCFDAELYDVLNDASVCVEGSTYGM
jgi:hypothetical protein